MLCSRYKEDNLGMSSKILVTVSFLLVLNGCVYTEEPIPIIAEEYSDTVIRQTTTVPIKPPLQVNKMVPRGWKPPTKNERKWTAIILHHSGGANGNAAIFDKWHKEGMKWSGVGYDFVIGNGTNSGDGQVEVTYRWNNQQTGAHCRTPNNWANKKAIGICLVGDFNKKMPSWAQMQSVLKLVRFLQKRYGISKTRIYSHRFVPGANPTDCPGKKFPMNRLKAMLDF